MSAAILQELRPLSLPAGVLPTLTTARLVLRAPVMDDAGAIALCLGDYEVSRMLARVPSPYFRQDAVDWLEGLENGVGEHRLSFVCTLEGVVVGNVGVDLTGKGPEIGYWLARSHWRRGLMSEAVAAVLDWYFDSEPDGVIRSGVFADNAASLGLQRKLGFVETGVGQVFSLARGRLCTRIETRIDAALLANGCRARPSS